MPYTIAIWRQAFYRLPVNGCGPHSMCPISNDLHSSLSSNRARYWIWISQLMTFQFSAITIIIQFSFLKERNNSCFAISTFDTINLFASVLCALPGYLGSIKAYADELMVSSCIEIVWKLLKRRKCWSTFCATTIVCYGQRLHNIRNARYLEIFDYFRESNQVRLCATIAPPTLISQHFFCHGRQAPFDGIAFLFSCSECDQNAPEITSQTEQTQRTAAKGDLGTNKNYAKYCWFAFTCGWVDGRVSWLHGTHEGKCIVQRCLSAPPNPRPTTQMTICIHFVVFDRLLKLLSDTNRIRWIFSPRILLFLFYSSASASTAVYGTFSADKKCR